MHFSKKKKKMQLLQLLLFLLLRSCLSLSLESSKDARRRDERRGCSSGPASIPAGAIEAAMEDLIGQRSSARANLLSDECAAAWKKLWRTADDSGTSLGLRAIDSSGKIGAGVLDGNMYALGSYDECRSIDRGDLGMQFCIIPVALYRHLNNDTSVNGSRLLRIEMALCWPEECSLSDIRAGLPFASLQLNRFLPGSEFELKMDEAEAHCSTGRPALNAGAVMMIVVCSAILTVVLASTFVDWLFRSPIRKRKKQKSQPNPSTGSDLTKSEETTPLTDGPEKDRQSALLALITAFSLSKSVAVVLSTAQPANTITCINGLRVLSMVWVLVCVTHLWAFELGMDNAPVVLDRVAPQFANQVIINGFLAVDTFLLIGGLLSSYLTLNKMASGTHKWRIFFVRYYVHRIFRLTPTYIFVLFFYWLLTMHLADGPVYELNTGENSIAYSNCQKYWWTNLLYINNLYPWKLEDVCMKWSWYLTSDIQFYALAPLIVVPLYWLWPVGLTVAGTVICGCLISSGLAAGLYELDANVFVHPMMNTTEPRLNEPQTIDELIKPYTRIAPYIVGILLGYVIFRRIKLSFDKVLNWSVHIVLWVVAISLCFSVVFGLHSTWHGRTLTAAENILYLSFGYLAWGSGIALIILSCHSGYGGVINRLLSMRIWVPLSRLTFGVYLVHPIVLTVTLSSLHSPLHYTFTTIVVYVTATICLSYAAAGLLAVFLEFPITNLEAALTHQFGFELSESVREGRKTSAQPNKAYQDVLV